MAVVIFKWWVGDGWVVDSGDDLETTSTSKRTPSVQVQTCAHAWSHMNKQI